MIGSLNVTEAFLDFLRKARHKPPRFIFVTSSTGSTQEAANPELNYFSGITNEYRTSKAALNMMMVMCMAR